MVKDNSRYLQKLHLEILSIMDEVIRVCKGNNIRYYIVGGTLLGAIRHNGFIPWDDDFDIAMPREDFERFIALAPQELSSEYYLEWITCNPYYWNLFPKVCKKRTLFKEQNLKVSTGIFIDIFPLDLGPSYSNKLNIIKYIIKKLNGISVCTVTTRKSWKITVYRIIRLLVGNKIIYKVINSLMLLPRKKGLSHYINFSSQYKLYKQTMPIEWYGEGQTVEFEGHTYIAPVEYSKVLMSIYGDEYMQLPPEDKRRTHYPLKVTFSDGETIEFLKTNKIVKVE